MMLVLLQMKETTLLSPSQQPYLITHSPPQLQSLNTVDAHDHVFNLNNNLSPSILLIIIILAVIFFVSGLLHLLVRFLLRAPSRETEDLESVTALQGQLQQLFHLHDAGVDQSFIDTLPVFDYKAIIGVKKTPFDCAVCLCEFESEDRLRLLPKCSHAFHMNCIDTWLLSHSTCPLCRTSLLSDFAPRSPIVLVLESGSESSREIGNDRGGSVLRSGSHLVFHGDNDLGSCRIDKSCEIAVKEESLPSNAVDSSEKVVRVRLGKFRNVGSEGTNIDDNNADARRCFSMGSFEYVMDENSSLQVPVRTPIKKQSSNKPPLPLKPGHRPAMSECDCESRREFSGYDIDIQSVITETNLNASVLSTSGSDTKRESFSLSKIWLRGKKEKQPNSDADCSTRAFSFRFPSNKVGVSDDDSKATSAVRVGLRRTQSELGISRMGSEENQCCNSNLASHAKTPSFARKPKLWFVGRPSKVVHSSFTPTTNNV